MEPEEPKDHCSCYRCLRLKGRIVTRMIVCNECGFKRCPHATNHRMPCTASNDPGKPGSVPCNPL
jgi:hypothetical protein